MTRAKMYKTRKLGSSKKKIVSFKGTSKIQYGAALREKHPAIKSVKNQKSKSTYTFSSIFPNEDIMNRAHKVISQVEFAK